LPDSPKQKSMVALYGKAQKSATRHENLDETSTKITMLQVKDGRNNGL
jgi:hypothetical protein